MSILFPPLSEKELKHLPEVFKEIIRWDAKDPRNLYDVVHLSAIKDYLAEIKDWKKNRNNLSEGARRVIQKQRGGPATA